MKQLAVKAVGHLYFFISLKPLDWFIRASSLSVMIYLSNPKQSEAGANMGLKFPILS